MRGIVVSYDSKKVVLSQRNGDVRIEVPRSAVAKQFKKTENRSKSACFFESYRSHQNYERWTEEKGRRKVFKKTIHN